MPSTLRISRLRWPDPRRAYSRIAMLVTPTSESAATIRMIVTTVT